jgi:hypothetical protein
MSRQLSAIFLLGCMLAHAQAINVQNPSFETATLPINGGNGPFCQLIAGSTIAGYVQSGSVANWTASSTTKNAGVGVSAPTPGGNNWTTKWWSGNNIAFVQATSIGTASLSQTLADVLQNNMVYTLSAQIGRPILAALDSEPVKFAYALQLWAGTTMLGSASNLALANNSSGTDTLTYSSGANNPQAGQPLMIVLTTSGANGVITEAFFDNITLTAASPAPPSIFTSGVVPIYSTSPVIEPGSWVSIYGSNLASGTMVWNGDFPISLGGTSVTINSKPAYLWFVSPTQINLQAPDDTATGTVEALIMQRMKNGGFHSVEEVLLEALKTPFPTAEQAGKTAGARTGTDLIAALQASPYREIDIEPARYRVPVRDPCPVMGADAV